MMTVKKPMRPVLKQVGDKKSEDEFNNKRKLLYPLMDHIKSDPAKEKFSRLLRDNAEKLYEQVTYYKINRSVRHSS